MDEPSTEIHRLATLIVEVLKIGTRGADRMATRVCDAFGIDLPSLVDAQPSFGDSARDATRAIVLAGLLEAPTPEALAEAFLKEGTAVVAMVDEIYQLLASRDATTSQTSESFRLRMDPLNLDITISAAFVEQVRMLLRRLVTVERGVIDMDRIGDLVRYDSGESYGLFPPDGPNARPLLHEIMLLGTVEDELRQRAAVDASFGGAVQACASTRLSTEGLLVRLESLVTSYVAGVLDEEVAPDAVSGSRQADFGERARTVERQTLLEHGMVGGPVMAGLFDELETDEFVGLHAAQGDPLTCVVPPEPIRSIPLADRYGHTISTLGAYLGIVRSGLTLRRDRWSEHDSARGRALGVLEAPTPGPAVNWLAEVARAADAATAWIDAEVWSPTGTSSTITNTEENLEDVLNLPLWRQREILFEIWVLCHTITTCEAQGWKVELRGMEGETWILPGQGAEEPVATLVRDSLKLDVWREAARGKTTPDVSLATPPPGSRDLVVIEVKDRSQMPTGLASVGAPGPKTALLSGLKYVRALGPTLTWVLNHGSFRGGTADPARNEGSPWHDLRLAAEVGPGSVPSAFGSSLSVALRPPAAGGLPRPELVLVLDTTSSMDGAWAEVADLLEGLEPQGWGYSALLVGDHGDDEEYVVRAVASQETPSELRQALEREPRTHGGDEPEALEDAMRRAAWQAAGNHQVFVVLTDAPPHPRSDCPSGVDFEDEVDKVLATGAAVWVVSDFLGSSASVWAPFIDRPHFALVTMANLRSHLAELGDFP